MAYFECIVGNGGGSEAIPLIVTCDAAFAGLTITATDGTTTLTDTCPSTSPYQIVFSLPNDGTWTVSGVISGTTFSESILISPYEVELVSTVDITVDVYSAANDTVSYTGLDNQTHTITTDSSGHASATITINASGSSITFTSSVAKDPENLSNDYSKTIALTTGTTSIYVMPVDDCLYWWGYKSSNTENLSSSNGWTPVTSSYSFMNPTESTNYVSTSCQSSKQCGYGSSTPQNFRYLKVIGMPVTYQGSSNAALTGMITNAKSLETSALVSYTRFDTSNSSQNVMSKLEVDAGSTSSYYVEVQSTNTQNAKVYAFWTE